MKALEAVEAGRRFARNAIVLAFRVADDKIKPATWSRSFVNAAFVNGMPMVGKVMALALRPADPSLSLLVGVHHGALRRPGRAR